ncbi:acyl-CoA dehydratase activase [Methanospirillum stamsii]|uniref:CoA activase n=1 Tax=Methanospirillum stamsii TaxID=1277351 RepID=A0A2V2MTP7_9EURY|nr:acyl-CoA dehydratase activase [Methanospirillum stamsii]PWR69700.1 CoA activase [Methanospirillum stamsii]
MSETKPSMKPYPDNPEIKGTKMLPEHFSIGIDIGYSSIKISLVNGILKPVYGDYVLHKGKIKETLKQMLATLESQYSPSCITTGAVTGSESKWISKEQTIHHVNDVSALLEGSLCLDDSVRSIIDIGGQTARYITGFTKLDKSGIEISMNSNCAAGTGSFLEEQVSRLNLSIEDYAIYAAKSSTIPRIAGRCSVFAKTDIIHHQQEGVSVEDILQGLAYALIRNYRGAVMKKLPITKPLFFAGGVAQNGAIVNALKEILNITKNDLIVSDFSENAAAIGTAIIARQNNLNISYDELQTILSQEDAFYSHENLDLTLPALDKFGQNDISNKHTRVPIPLEEVKTDCYLGIDIGSTSTNLVLINKKNEIIAYRYLRTLGDPVHAVSTGLAELGDEFGDKVRVIGAGTTGSGRYMISRLFGADIIKDEITAQAKAAMTIDAYVDTVFEIGGQDSKFISLKNGVVSDFQMNKICAAGTGSFIEEQSKKFDIPLDGFGERALTSKNPVYLGERCTVFIETSIAAHLANGTSNEDIISGLCYSIVKNYLNRVVGQKKIGNRIFLQGGIAYNQGIINAFRALTGKEVIVPPFFSVTGAYGAAILTSEEMGSKKSTFKGFYQSVPIGEEKEESVQQVTGSDFEDMVADLIFEGYDGTLDPHKKTIGIPRALFTYGMYPMFNAFFRELGYNVILSDPTSEKTIWLGQDYSLDETCYPIKLINGHVAELVEKKVDYIFFPDLYTVLHPGSHTRQDFGCPYMQLAFKLVNRAMELDKKGIKLLSPTIGFSLGEGFMKKSFMNLGTLLDRTPEQTGKALQQGMKAFKDFESRLEKRGKEIVSNLKPDEKVFVLISKTYGVADPVLNLGIPGKLKEMGFNTLAFYNIPECDISKEHPNMFWPFGQHILEAAQVVKQHPNLYAIFLTHHGCGPDTVFTHYFKEIMGDKPYLNIEVDEHSSGVGVVTRLEAFVNSLNHIPSKPAEDMSSYPAHVPHPETKITTNGLGFSSSSEYYLPDLYPYSGLFCEFLNKKGVRAHLFSPTSEKSIDDGRKHTITNEYFSMAALLGDALNIPGIRNTDENSKILFIPQSEGAEADGQYNRFIRTVLDEEGLSHIGIESPYIEDIIYEDEDFLNSLYVILIAGDLVLTTPVSDRARYLNQIKGMIQRNELDIHSLKTIAWEISMILQSAPPEKTVLAIGEPLVLYNDVLNSQILSEIENKSARIMYAPLSEYLWQTWKDYILQYGNERTKTLLQKLSVLEDYMSQIHQVLGEFSPYEEKADDLIRLADASTGYYAGAFGRYREAKVLGLPASVSGVITLSSMYENTGILLNTLHKGFDSDHQKPILNLTFDGTRNEHDESKVESFLYYL